MIVIIKIRNKNVSVLTVKNKTKLSIKTVFAIIIALAVILQAVSLVFSAILQQRYGKMQADMQNHNQSIALAGQLKEGSHSLTVNARNFAANDDYGFFVDYWRLVNVDKPRKTAVAEMKRIGVTAEEEALVELALQTSDELIELEKAAMLCVFRSDDLNGAEAILNKVAAENPECGWIDTALCEDILDSDASQEWATAFAGEHPSAYTREQYAEKAINILFCDDYNASVKTITDSVESFNESVTMRMESETNESVRSFSAMFTAIIAITAVMIVFILATIIILYVLLVKPIIIIKHSLDGDAELSSFSMSELQDISSNYNRSKEDFTAKAKELELQVNVYREQSRRDYLTRLANRGMLDEYLAGMFSGEPSPFLLFMIDADNFKCVNDTYGHVAGDEVLKEIAKIFKTVAFEYHGVAARYGGEEFVVIATGVDEGLADTIADKILERARDTKTYYENNEICVTLSIGSCYSLSEGVTLENIIKMADEALYASKASGKNRHTAYSDLH